MKVAIVGAGICGLYLGRKLSENGHQVTIFEKRDKIGKEVCSGLFSERILDFIPESRKLIQNQIEYCLIRLPKKTLKIEFSKKFLVMSHYELDNLAADLAEKSGAKIILNQEISSLPETFDRIIGCDGANSFVRRYLKLPDPNFWLAIRGFTPESSSVGYVETWPTESGFIWKIPRAREIAEASPHLPKRSEGREMNEVQRTPPRSVSQNSVIEWGIIEKPKRAKTLNDEDKSSSSPFAVARVGNEATASSSPFAVARVFEEFLTKKGIKLEKINSAIVPQGFIIPNNPKITLCGDAAGLTKPWSGGGVIWGLFAANLLLKSFPDFIKYQKEARSFFLPKIILSKIAKKTVYFLGFNFPWLLPKNYKIESDFLT